MYYAQSPKGEVSDRTTKKPKTYFLTLNELVASEGKETGKSQGSKIISWIREWIMLNSNSMQHDKAPKRTENRCSRRLKEDHSRWWSHWLGLEERTGLEHTQKREACSKGGPSTQILRQGCVKSKLTYLTLPQSKCWINDDFELVKWSQMISYPPYPSHCTVPKIRASGR